MYLPSTSRIPPVYLLYTSCKAHALTLTYPTAVSASHIISLRKVSSYVYAVLGMLPCPIVPQGNFHGTLPPYLLSVVLIETNNRNISGQIGYSVPL